MEPNIKNVAILSGVGGLVLGYLIGRRRSSAEFETAVEDALEEMRLYYKDLEAKTRNEYTHRLNEQSEEIVAASARARESWEALQTYQGVQALEEAEAYQPTTDQLLARNNLLTREDIMSNDPKNSPYPKGNTNLITADEFLSRDRSKAYLITTDEFLNSDTGFAQSTLTYYKGDDTLASEDDEVMDPKARLLFVGTHLGDFGAFGGDPNTVYIRNEQMQVEVEVVLYDGEYGVVVGFGDRE